MKITQQDPRRASRFPSHLKQGSTVWVGWGGAYCQAVVIARDGGQLTLTPKGLSPRIHAKAGRPPFRDTQ